MPWYWDIDHYSGDNEDMIGFFYWEDMVNVEVMSRMGI